MDLPILSIITFLPLVGIPFIALTPRQLPGAARAIAMTFMLVTFGISLYLFAAFDGTQAGFQFLEEKAWIFESIRYKMGIDGISILLVLLTTFLSPIALLSAVRSVNDKVREFAIAMLALETAMIGTFLALDLFLFYVFWELMLIPMYIIIGVWGGPRRIYATVKFVLYTMVGSVLMLVALLYIYFKAGGSSFDYSFFTTVLSAEGAVSALSIKEQALLFAAFGLAFAVKVPFFPFHTWLPDAHVEAPTPGSVILAGVLLKMGTYGFIRFAIPLFPDAAALFSAPLMALAVVGIIYGALVAYAQKDMKKLVAYSSVSHLGFVMLGMFAMTREGIAGSVLQMVNHGLSSGALFLCVGFLYERRHTRMMADFGGLARVMPFFTVTFIIVALSSIGLPGTNGFVGEFLILAGVFKEGIGSVLETGRFFGWRTLVLSMGVLAATGIILGAVYTLTMVRRTMFGPLTHDANRNLADLSLRERLVILPVIALIILIGVAPGIFLDKTQATVDHYVETYQARIMQKRNPATAERNKQMMRQLIDMQIKNSLEAAGGLDVKHVEWKLGPVQEGGRHE